MWQSTLKKITQFKKKGVKFGTKLTNLVFFSNCVMKVQQHFLVSRY